MKPKTITAATQDQTREVEAGCHAVIDAITRAMPEGTPLDVLANSLTWIATTFIEDCDLELQDLGKGCAGGVLGLLTSMDRSEDEKLVVLGTTVDTLSREFLHRGTGRFGV